VQPLYWTPRLLAHHGDIPLTNWRDLAAVMERGLFWRAARFDL
jgi:hypothetical protein